MEAAICIAMSVIDGELVDTTEQANAHLDRVRRIGCEHEAVRLCLDGTVLVSCERCAA